MADLYTNRLNEIHGMVRLLTDDVDKLHVLLGERLTEATVTEEQNANRRFYVRAIFALVEAVVEQHKQLLLDLAKSGKITLGVGVYEALSELVYAVKDNGEVFEREQYLTFRSKLRLIYKTAGDVFGVPLQIRFDDQGWSAFRSAIEVRDRITHPKTLLDCHIAGDVLNVVDNGHQWFKGVNNEFVRVARAHKQQNNW
jgi:hypothetical protein